MRSARPPIPGYAPVSYIVYTIYVYLALACVVRMRIIICVVCLCVALFYNTFVTMVANLLHDVKARVHVQDFIVTRTMRDIFNIIRRTYHDVTNVIYIFIDLSTMW